MASHGVSECTLDENDLPENVFDSNWKDATKFSEFSNNALLSKKMNNMENWIKTFKEKLFTIYTDNTLGDVSHTQDKRCRDLNYYISYVLYYIPKITKSTEDFTDIIDRFEVFLKGLFSSWRNINSMTKFKCERTDKLYTPKMDLIKELDDYCENKKNFQETLQTYDYRTCCKYATYVRDKKRSFYVYILRGYTSKNDDDLHIDNNCTLKDFGKTFPNVTCIGGIMSEIEDDELQIPYGHGYLSSSQQQESSGKGQEDSFNSSPTKIALTSVSTLLGACLSGLYIYRHSFVGSMIRNFQNRNHISHEDTYDDVDGMFSEGPLHYVDTLQENNAFHITYDPINN
ncbi:PIR Superfamily Protein [Plasmodium ovale wallikeri]|uniref:PIR Superfamily Protein n=1 Tax=Plasmodium ovale wallikeri TaxID=864142 RepID=A0A1A9AM83_PLAOA|nr:PIR Superfamily Protein [Plasmodium ovale wallikeri]